MAIPKETNMPPGGGKWSKLETVGDVRRYLRWLILQAKIDKMDVRKASVMGQLGLYLLKTLEASEFEARLDALERRLEQSEQSQGTSQHDEPRSQATTH